MTIAAALEGAFRDAVASLSPARRVAEDLRARSLPSAEVTLLAVGKAAASMAAGAASVLGDAIARGAVVAPSESHAPYPLVSIISAHPTPDERSVAAARTLCQLAAEPAQLVIALVSGGASALIALPAPGLSLEDKVAATKAVYRAGAPIDELNIVRKHVSAIKGGRLCHHASAPVLTLVASDVVGDELGAVGSGPTIPDESTYADAMAIIEARCGWSQVPARVRRHLEAGARGEHGDTSARRRPGDTAALVCGIAMAAEAAVHAVRARGLPALACGPAFTADVETVVDDIEDRLTALRGRGPSCLVLAGEATIRVAADPGTGGRAQHLALLLAKRLRGEIGATVLVCGTDGIDGNSPAAGAVVDGSTWGAIARAWGDPDAALARCDSHAALVSVGAAVTTGPTGVNHADLVLVHVDAGW